MNEEALPEQLMRRLSAADGELLRQVATAVLEQLRRVYDMDSRAFDPLVGDNAQLFGFGIWTHGWYFIEHALADVERAIVTHRDHSHQIRIGPLTAGVYKVGDTSEESIDAVELDGSETKQSYPRLNQLALFDADVDVAVPERAFALNHLVIAHYGNHRAGFAAAWIGAPTYDEQGRFKWAWRRRLDTPLDDDSATAPADGSPGPTPFTDQPEPDFDLEIREDPGEIEADDHNR